MDPHPAPVPSDLLAEDIAEAVAQLDDGRVTLARRRLSTLWRQVSGPSGTGHAGHRSAVAHWLAGTESDAEAAVAWDERALAEAEAAEDWSLPFAGTAGTVARSYPELHLALARGYVRLGSACGALEHLARARTATEALPAQVLPAPLRRRLLEEIDRVDRELASSGPAATFEEDEEPEPWHAHVWDDDPADGAADDGAFGRFPW